MRLKAATLIAVASAATLIGCAKNYAPDEVPSSFEGVCSKNVDVEGFDDTEEVARIADTACVEVQRALRDHEPDERYEFPKYRPHIKVRVYGVGEGAKWCEARSGTCTQLVDKKIIDGKPATVYRMEIRKPNNRDYHGKRFKVSVPDVYDKLRHEFQHVALFELEALPLPSRHHRKMLSLDVCHKPKMCDDSFDHEWFKLQGESKWMF